VPVAQAKPEPANVAPAAVEPDVMTELDDAGPLDATDADTAADADAGADEDAGALTAAEEDAGATTALEDDELDEVVLDEEVVLLSLPQALIVSAPATSRASRPVLRVIFTPFPPQVRNASRLTGSRVQIADAPGARCIAQAMHIGR
jgi:hypothetical protein